jgi:hypothetical protein
MKTALQELIELMEDFKGELKDKYDGDPWVTRGVLISIAEAKKLLRKEREQIEEAFFDGDKDGRSEYYKKFVGSQDYYTKTYSKDETKTNRL